MMGLAVAYYAAKFDLILKMTYLPHIRRTWLWEAIASPTAVQDSPFTILSAILSATAPRLPWGCMREPWIDGAMRVGLFFYHATCTHHLHVGVVITFIEQPCAGHVYVTLSTHNAA